MTNIEMRKKQQRNYGIDFLRILSMLFVVILHILGHGGIIENLKVFSISYELIWLLEIATYCAVNCFALISGYVGYKSKYKFSNIINIYAQVLFYNIIITIIFKFLDCETVSGIDWVKAFFPLIGNQFWYFDAYFCMFFFIPFFNSLIELLDQKIFKKLLITILIIYSLLPTLLKSDFGNTLTGNSSLWLSLLYFIGAYFKKFGINIVEKKGIYLFGYVSCVGITWCSKLFIEILMNHLIGKPKGGGYLIAYTSPTILLSAVFLFLFFANLKFNDYIKKFISVFAPAAFGVYIIHLQKFIWEELDNAFVSFIDLNPFVRILAIFGTSLGIWLFCSIIDLIRMKLFSLLKINKQFEKIDNFFSISKI